jgi:hypothetical protein
MLGSSVGLQFMQMHLAMKVGLPLVMLAVAIWLWSRPESDSAA